MNTFDHGLLLQQFVNGLPDCAVTLLDVDGNVLTWNDGARAVLGYVVYEIVGRNYSCLYTKDDISTGKPSTSLAAAARAQGPYEERARRVRKDGTEFEAQSVLIPLYDQQKNLVGFGNMIRGVAGSRHVAADAAVPHVEAMLPPRANDKILVVDDDALVRQVTLDQLSSLGYQVVVASSGAQALDTLARLTDIDLLFTDVSMPGGMGGREVAEKAQLLRPGLKVLFASGYFEGALVSEGALKDNVEFIVKPYRKADLARKIQGILNGTVTQTTRPSRDMRR